jgi:hypothetical protein
MMGMDDWNGKNAASACDRELYSESIGFIQRVVDSLCLAFCNIFVQDLPYHSRSRVGIDTDGGFQEE